MTPEERVKFIDEIVSVIAKCRPKKADDGDVTEAVFMALQLTTNMYRFNDYIDCFARRRD